MVSLESSLAKRRRSAVIAAIVAVPFLLEIGLVVSAKLFQHAVPWYGNFVSQALSACVGALLLVYYFRWRGLGATIIYLPVMFALLVYFSLVFAGVVFHDPL